MNSAKPLRIALPVSSLHGGGAERVVLALARGFLARGYGVDLLLFDLRVHYPDWIPADARLFVADSASAVQPGYGALRVRPRPWGARDGLALARALRGDFLALPSADKLRKARCMAAYIERERPDIILPSLSSATVASLLARHLVVSPPPVIPILHSLMKRKHNHRPIRHSALFADAARVVAVSDGVAASAREEAGIDACKLVTIYNPVIAPELDDLKAQTPTHAWFIDTGAPVILACGRLKEVKDFALLLNAFARVVQRRSCRLIILGEGPLRASLTDLAKQLGVADKVSLPGFADNPYAFMARASLFVLSSRREGLPTALIEALACGCPCVSVDCPSGPAEILQGGAIGRLTPVGDAAALADAMLQTLAHPPARDKLTARAGFFSAERAVGLYEDLIRVEAA